MSKTIAQLLFLPGKAGWEIWSQQGPEAPTRVVESDHSLAGDLDALPAGDVTICFPARMVTALPMKVATDDESLFPDLVTLHAERLGLRPDPMAGQLTDWFEIAKEEESASLLAVLLRSPGDGELPTRGPKGFDVSARAFPVEGAAVAVWIEFGRWVFSIHQDGVPVYLQATGVESEHPDEALGREIQLAAMQLEMQNMPVSPRRVLVWSSREDLETGGFSRLLGLPCEVLPKPDPSIPQPLSRLLPADVRAARREAQKRRNMTMAVAAAVVLYLALVGWLGFGLWQTISKTKELKTAAIEAVPDAAQYTAHMQKWNELQYAIDITHAPVDILHRIAMSIPPRSGLRLTSASVSANEVKLIGEAQTLEAVNSFSLKLNKNNALGQFEWQTPEPSQSKLGWKFAFTGELR